MIKCLQVLYSLGRGGTETTVKNYLSALYNDDEIHFDVLVHKNVENGYEEEVKAFGINVFQIDHYNVVGVFSYLKNFYAFIKNGNYDVIHIHMDAACGILSIIAKQAGIKRIICHSHSAGISNLGGRKGVILNRIIYHFVNPICLACGRDAGLAMYGSRKFTVLNNGIDTIPFLKHDFSKNGTKKQLSIPMDSKIILHVGRFDKPKNQSFLIDIADEVIERNKSVFFVFAGQGNCFEMVKREAEKCKNSDRIIFLGLVSNVSQIMCDSDLFVLPSIFEGFPVTTIEAQCAGLPCLVSTGVTREACLLINHFEYLELDKKIWVDRIDEFLGYAKTDVLNNVEILEKKGFTSHSRAEYLRNIYLGNYLEDV